MSYEDHLEEKNQPSIGLVHLLRVRELEAERDALRGALEEIKDGTTPDRIGRYDLLRDWVHKTASKAARGAGE